MYCKSSALNDNFVVVGYSTSQHLLLDLDRIGFYRAQAIAHMVYINYPHVGAYLVVHSSGNNFHVVYDALIGWRKITKIVSTLAGLHILNRDYMRIRKFRGDLTLRVNGHLTTAGPKFPPTPYLLYMPANYNIKKGGGILRYLNVLEAYNPVWATLWREQYRRALLRTGKQLPLKLVSNATPNFT
jgi:hypothetical protein